MKYVLSNEKYVVILTCIVFRGSWGSSVSMVTGLWAGRPGFGFW